MGNKKVCEYLMGLGRPKVLDLLKPGEMLRKSDLDEVKVMGRRGLMPVFSDEDETWFVKIITGGFTTEHNDAYVSSEVLNSRAYNKIGVPSIVYYPSQIITSKKSLKTFSRNTEEDENYVRQPIVMSRNILDLKPFKSCPARIFLDMDRLFNNEGVAVNYIINIEKDLLALKDENGRQLFSKNCINELIDMMVADIVFNQTDRHSANFFFYKTDPEGPYEGVITFDHEYNYVSNTFRDLSFESFKEQLFDIDFSNYKLDNGVESNEETFIENIRLLREMYKKGSFRRLDRSDVIENFLGFDLEKTINEIKIDAKYDINQKYKDRMKYMIETAQTVLGE